MELEGYQIRTARINSLDDFVELSRGSSVVSDNYGVMLQTDGSKGGVEKAGRTQGGEARCRDDAKSRLRAIANNRFVSRLAEGSCVHNSRHSYVLTFPCSGRQLIASPTDHTLFFFCWCKSHSCPLWSASRPPDGIGLPSLKPALAFETPLR